MIVFGDVVILRVTGIPDCVADPIRDGDTPAHQVEARAVGKTDSSSFAGSAPVCPDVVGQIVPAFYVQLAALGDGEHAPLVQLRVLLDVEIVDRQLAVYGQRFPEGNNNFCSAGVDCRVCRDGGVLRERKLRRMTVDSALQIVQPVRIRRREQAGAQEQAQQQRQPDFMVYHVLDSFPCFADLKLCRIMVLLYSYFQKIAGLSDQLFLKCSIVFPPPRRRPGLCWRKPAPALRR